jgi:6-phosphogluconolactonase (cycloisomerase 2 family)
MIKHKIALLILFLSASFAYGQQHHPEYVYVSDSGIAGFSVNRGTGVLTAVPENGTIFHVSGPIATAPTGQFVFGGDSGITVAAIDRATGELMAVPGSPFATGLFSSALAVTPNGRVLIVGSGSSLYTYSIDGEVGAVTPAGLPVPLTASATSLAVSPSNRFVYVGTGGDLQGYAISPQTGELTPLALNATGSNLVISSDGKFLYASVVTLLPNTVGIYAYSVDAQSGILTAVPGSPFMAAPSPQPYLAIDPTGRFLYETAGGGVLPASLAGYLINPLSGALEDTVIGSPFPIALGVPVAIVIDHSGNFVYTADFDVNLIGEFGVNGITGSLGPLAGTMPQVLDPGGITITAPSPASTATLTSLSIEPVNPSVISGETTTEQFSAAGMFSDGSHRFLTASVAWSSGTPSVATISNAPGQSGAATILSNGSTVIDATLNGISAQTTLTVGPATLVSVAVTPAAPAVEVGTDIQFTATGTYADGTMKDLTDSAAWSSSNSSVASVNRKGVAQGTGAGTATIRAASGKVVGSTVLTVVAADR